MPDEDEVKTDSPVETPVEDCVETDAPTDEQPDLAPLHEDPVDEPAAPTDSAA